MISTTEHLYKNIGMIKEPSAAIEYLRKESIKSAILFIVVESIDEIIDACGVKARNVILNHIENILKADNRYSGKAYLYKEDKYIVLLPGLDTAAAAEISQKLKKTIEDKKIRFELKDNSGIFVSTFISARIGVSFFGNEETQDISKVLDSAEESVSGKMPEHAKDN